MKFGRLGVYTSPMNFFCHIGTVKFESSVSFRVPLASVRVFPHFYDSGTRLTFVFHVVDLKKLTSPMSNPQDGFLPSVPNVSSGTLWISNLPQSWLQQRGKLGGLQPSRLAGPNIFYGHQWTIYNCSFCPACLLIMIRELCLCD